jgi:hypothetical protein
MLNLIKNRNFWLMLFCGIALAMCAYGLSYLIRFEGKIPAEQLPALKNTIFGVVALKVMSSFMWGG